MSLSWTRHQKNARQRGCRVSIEEYVFSLQVLRQLEFRRHICLNFDCFKDAIWRYVNVQYFITVSVCLVILLYSFKIVKPIVALLWIKNVHWMNVMQIRISYIKANKVRKNEEPKMSQKCYLQIFSQNPTIWVSMDSPGPQQSIFRWFGPRGPNIGSKYLLAPN